VLEGGERGWRIFITKIFFFSFIKTRNWTDLAQSAIEVMQPLFTKTNKTDMVTSFFEKPTNSSTPDTFALSIAAFNLCQVIFRNIISNILHKMLKSGLMIYNNTNKFTCSVAPLQPH
jgi:hypothetical protein